MWPIGVFRLDEDDAGHRVASCPLLTKFRIPAEATTAAVQIVSDVVISKASAASS
jgi:hypothetical protein